MMTLTTKFDYTVPQASREAADILKEEANQLASLIDNHAEYDKLPHRGKIAINREIYRLRAIATALLS